MVSIDELICNKFNVTSRGYAPHKESMQYIISLLGYNKVKKCIPFSLSIIKEALKIDENLNSLPLKVWDKAAGFEQWGHLMNRIGSPLTHLYNSIGINCYSCAEGVSILKECARMWANEISTNGGKYANN